MVHICNYCDDECCHCDEPYLEISRYEGKPTIEEIKNAIPDNVEIQEVYKESNGNIIIAFPQGLSADIIQRPSMERTRSFLESKGFSVFSSIDE